MPRHIGQPLHEGRVQHHGRFAFLLAEKERTEDLMLRGPTLGLAMDGDRVVARLVPGEPGRSVGEIVSVVARARHSVTGVLRRLGPHWLAVPEGSDARDGIRVLGFGRGMNPREGEIVVVKITRWPTLRETAGGEVCEVLGLPDEAGVRLRAILRALGLPESFPDAVLAESKSFPDSVPRSMWAGRRDLRSLPVFTIDGADAKDFDDAVSLESLDHRTMRLGVHIADVAHYVRKGTAVDSEASRRATSIYLADRVVPMLPPCLSEKLCSLMPGVERLTLSCFMDVDLDGRVVGACLDETVIRSRRRFTYEEIEAILNGKSVQDVDPHVRAAVLRMGTLHKMLHHNRAKRGALDLSVPEYTVQVDQRGRPLEILRRPRLASHRLIEEFMLLANETVAGRLLSERVAFLSRVHPDPDPRRLVALGTELRKLGVNVPASMAGNPSSGLRSVLAKVAGQPIEEIVNVLVMRSLKLAAYSHLPGGHFGLASKAYCHFTSPIRRYPDLLVHRAVKALLHKSATEPLAAGLAELGVHCSERERVATDAERRSVDILRAELLQKKVGQVFDGVVSGSASFGLFVTLGATGAVGLLRGESAPLGAHVSVRLDRVNPGNGELDLSLPGSGAAAPALHVPHSPSSPKPQPRLQPSHPPRPKPQPTHPRAGRPKPKFYERFLKKRRSRRY